MIGRKSGEGHVSRRGATCQAYTGHMADLGWADSRRDTRKVTPVSSATRGGGGGVPFWGI
ncbi:hypothetical protein HanIR_Chr16g0834281 [Helianthus annuus]|nr:hypothetical protein HanIR_Chr16g0834281 [Helianthus annuus]